MLGFYFLNVSFCDPNCLFKIILNIYFHYFSHHFHQLQRSDPIRECYGPLQFGEKLVDVSVTIVLHEKNVLVFKLRLVVAPFQLRISGPGKDEAVQNDVWVIQPLFDFFDTLMEQQLLTRRAFVQKAVWLYESDVLF